MSISWENPDPDLGDTLFQDVYLSTVNLPSLKAVSGLLIPKLRVSGLENDKDYHWRVVVSDGGESVEGEVWSFTTIPPLLKNSPPDEPEVPDPEDGEDNLPINLTLMWNGTDPDALLMEHWTGISGTGVGNLTGNSSYSDDPSVRYAITVFQTPADVLNEYGTRIRGYVRPPATGEYTF